MEEEVVTRATNSRRTPKTLYLLTLLALVVGSLGLFLPSKTVSSLAAESALKRIQMSRLLRVGYEGYPPYTIEDPTTGEVTGYSVDLAERLAREAGWKLEWIKTTPDTKIPDLYANRFDIMVEPIFRTIPRAARVSFTQPYSYFGFAAVVVPKGVSYSSIEQLNDPSLTLAVRQGYTDEAWAQEHLPNARLRALDVDDINQVFLEVTTGSSDAALADVSQARQYVKEHSGEVDLLFDSPAPAYVPAGFMLPPGDFALYNFLNVSLDYLEANGFLDRLKVQYDIDAATPAEFFGVEPEGEYP